MPSSKELMEKRAESFAVMQELLKTAGEEKRKFTGEEQQKFDRARDECDLLLQQAQAQRELETRVGVQIDGIDPPDNVNADLIPSGHDPPRGTPRLSRDDYARGLRNWLLVPTGLVNSDDLDLARRCGFDPMVKTLTLRKRPTSYDPVKYYLRHEQAVTNHREARAQSVGTATAGGNLVPDEMMAAMEVATLAFGGMRSVSTIRTTDSGADLPIPTSDDTSNKGAIIAEGVQDIEQDISVGQLILQAYMYTSRMIRASIEFIQDSSTDVPTWIGNAIGERIARIHNEHFTTGTGTSQPNGIVTAATDSGVTAAAAAALTFDEVLELEHTVDPSYRGPGSAFMGNDTTLRIMKQITDDANQFRPLWLPSLTPGEPDLFDGHPYVVNQDMADGTASKALLFGQLNKYQIRDVRDITVVRLDERYADFRQVAWVGFWRADGDLLDAGTNPVKYLTMA